MDANKLVFVNTIAQYSKSLINVCLSLYSARIILDALGKSDFGLYALVGGVVAMLGFITNALVITTQRFISYYHGKNDREIVRQAFSNSLFLHIVLAVLLSLLLASLSHPVIYSWIEVAPNRLPAALSVYFATIVILFCTVLISPFKAVLIARENIVYISVIDVLDGVLKLGVAFFLLRVDLDRLQLYAWLMVAIQVFNLLAFSIYGCWKYEECSWIVRFRDISSKWLGRLLGFAGWTTYSMGVVVGRNQGISVMFNHFLKQTIINAAYGIAFHVYGSISFIASSILNAMNPRIMKAEGRGDRKEMLHLSALESKYSSLMLILLLTPLLFEMDAVLVWWLKEVPEHTSMFCRFVIIALIVDQMTYGLNTANQATGRIRTYILLVYTPKLLILIPIGLSLYYGSMPIVAMYYYLAAEVFCSLLRLPYLHYTCGLDIRRFLLTAVVPLVPVLLTQLVCSYLLVAHVVVPYRFVLTEIVSVLLGGIVAWKFSLSSSERVMALSFFKLSSQL